jgi:hypothetical protein
VASKRAAEELECVILKGSVAVAHLASLGGAGLLDLIPGLCRGFAFHGGHFTVLTLPFFLVENCLCCLRLVLQAR